MQESGIYKISSPSGSFYIGSAAKLSKRKNQHFHLLRNGRHHSPALQRAFDKYGALTFEVLFYCEQSTLLEMEQRSIDVLRPKYNVLRVAGRVTGYRHTDESIRKMRVAQVGRKQSDEHRFSISKGVRAAILSDPGIAKRMSVLRKGRKTRDDTKEKMSVARSAHWARQNDEYRDRARERMSGENSPVAIYTWEQIRAIRAEFDEANGRRGIQRELCEKYGMNPATMSGIINRKIWKENG